MQYSRNRGEGGAHRIVIIHSLPDEIVYTKPTCDSKLVIVSICIRIFSCYSDILHSNKHAFVLFRISEIVRIQYQRLNKGARRINDSDCGEGCEFCSTIIFDIGSLKIDIIT